MTGPESAGGSRAEQALYELQRFGMKLGLEHIRAVLAELGNPQETFLSAHIAGTNGKGTAAAACEAVLRAHGLVSGLYTSPHLLALEERIRVRGEPLPAEFFAAWMETHLTALAARRVTFFEAVTALGFDWFRAAGVQAAAVEVGLGGRFDATNVIVPAVAAITSIGLEHRQYLGPTLAHIAAEKAGIAKPGVPLLVAERKRSALEAIAAAARAAGSPLLLFDEQVRLRGRGATIAGGSRFDCRGPGFALEEVRAPLYGLHQQRNLALGLWAAVVLLERLGKPLEPALAREALERLNWPGRFQRVSAEGFPGGLILDVAHNPAAAGRLAHVFRLVFGGRPATAIVALAADKEAGRFLGALGRVAERFIFPVVDFGRADRPGGGVDPQKLLRLARTRAPHAGAQLAEGMGQALALAHQAGDSPVLVTGSFRTVAAAMRELGLRV